ncbi:MAG: TIGR00341 family protein [Dermatophilaceae bacterium]
MSSIREIVLPPSQRWDLGHLRDHLDLLHGDRAPKVSAFWTMLTLSAVIAVAGVLGNSTATVIGAMIIAPLGVPIMGIALGIVRGDGRVVGRSAAFVAGGLVLVMGIGLVASAGLPQTTDLLTNPQVTGRTSPTLVDMIAAIATGLAGAVGMSRRDVSDVLPGVAIAISLVPPLGVVGVCAGQGQWELALGAFVLFASNMVAMVLAGTLTFTAYGYATDVATEGARGGGLRRRRAYTAIAASLVLVLIPLLANTVATTLVALWTQRVSDTAQAWVGRVPGARVTGVTAVSRTAVISILCPGDPPSVSDLMKALDGQVPDGIKIVVDSSVGKQIDAGVVGAPGSAG